MPTPTTAKSPAGPPETPSDRMPPIFFPSWTRSFGHLSSGGLGKAAPSKDFQEVLEQNLKVMDAAAIALCRENHLPILVFNMMAPGNLLAAVRGDVVGTLVN